MEASCGSHRTNQKSETKTAVNDVIPKRFENRPPLVFMSYTRGLCFFRTFKIVVNFFMWSTLNFCIPLHGIKSVGVKPTGFP